MQTRNLQPNVLVMELKTIGKFAQKYINAFLFDQCASIILGRIRML